MRIFMKKKKRALTLLEIMIVIALITLITGVIGYNMRGTLDRGRAFRTEQAKEQLHDLLVLALSEPNSTGEKIEKNPPKYLRKLGLAKNVDRLTEDGWGKKFTIKYVAEDDDFQIESEPLNKFNAKKNQK